MYFKMSVKANSNQNISFIRFSNTSIKSKLESGAFEIAWRAGTIEQIGVYTITFTGYLPKIPY